MAGLAEPSNTFTGNLQFVLSTPFSDRDLVVVYASSGYILFWVYDTTEYVVNC